MSCPTLSLTRRERYAAQRGAIVFALRPPDRRVLVLMLCLDWMSPAAARPLGVGVGGAQR